MLAGGQASITVRNFGFRDAILVEAVSEGREGTEAGSALELGCSLISLVYRTDRLALASDSNVFLPRYLSAIDH